MPLIFTKADPNDVCDLSHWYVEAHDEFVTALAWLYMQRVTHAQRVIEGLEPGAAATFEGAKEGAIRNLQFNISDIAADLTSGDNETREKAENKRDARMAHRDGLLFQHISWIAARMQFPSAQASPPHVRKADKGFDGFLVDVDTANIDISRVIVCEDKASVSPRNLVTSSIWPELKEIVAGKRNLEVLSAIMPLLSSLSEDDREVAIGRIVWNKARHYRVALTAGQDQMRDGTYNYLFDGFDDHATGDVSARLAEVMPMDNVRKYLDDLAKEVIEKIEAMA